MQGFADDRYTDVWCSHLDVEDAREAFRDQLTKKERKRGEKFVRKARSKNSLHALTSSPSRPTTATASPRNSR